MRECLWEYDEDEGFWITDCRNYFTFIDQGPKENSFKYCCYCGGKLIEEGE